MEEKKKPNILFFLFALIGVPFVATLYKFFKKGPDEPATIKDLLCIFGAQVLIAALLLIYVMFFHHGVAVLG